MEYKDFTLEDWVDYIYELIKNGEALDSNDMRRLLFSLIRFLLETLNQECILNKVKIEIKRMTPTYRNPDSSITDLVPISEVLKLIDKCIAESESV